VSFNACAYGTVALAELESELSIPFESTAVTT